MRFNIFYELAVVSFVLNGATDVCAITDADLPAIFYPFGPDVGDSTAPVNDDGYTNSVPIGIGFPFFNSTRTSVIVNTNGAISFQDGVSSFTPSPFPILSAPMVAVYWCDVDTRIAGQIYYRETTDANLLARASRDIQSGFTPQGFYYFQARWIFVATWHNVTYYGGSTATPRQSFQIVLATDGLHSFAMYNYGTMKWTTGTASGGNPSTGLGGTPAQVGFNAGDAVNYYVVPWSRTSQIVDIWTSSNIGTTGRWAFRIDNSRITPAGCAKPQGSNCYAWQIEDGGVCVDIAPSFECPVLSGPTVIDRLWLEFYCSIATNVTNATARFEIAFTFDGLTYNDVPVSTVDVSNPRATLHERYLHGRLGKWIGCKVTSYWLDTATQQSLPITNEHSYLAGIEVTSSFLRVVEGEKEPATLVLKSTLPITCPDAVSANDMDIVCRLWFSISTTTDVSVRQRHPALRKLRTCSYVIVEDDWKALDNAAFNTHGPLEIAPKVDEFFALPRPNSIRFSVPVLPDKTVNGVTYPNPWSGYRVLPDILVSHVDLPPYAVCTSSGDPHIDTFDHFHYSTFSTGQFVYVASISGLPIEIHVRHWPCGATVSCVCGVAIREDDTILIADMCNDRIVHYLTYSINGLPSGAAITTSEGGYSFKLQMPSGSKVLSHVYDWGMNIEMFVSAGALTVGMCGSYDADPTNDLLIKDTTQHATLTGDQPSNEFIDSWRVPPGFSLFDGYLSDLPRGDPDSETVSTYCQCGALPECGGPAVTDDSPSAWEPRVPVRPRVPATSLNGTNNSTIYTVDHTYDGANFTDNRTNIITLTWPTLTGITEIQAEAGCGSRILNNDTVGPMCFDALSADDVSAIIRKCVQDVQITGDFSFAADKIPEVQRLCVNLILSRNYTDINDTNTLHDAVINDLSSVTDYTCEPADCSGHGTCNNGSCVCTGDYIGSDCSVSRTTVPSIDRLLVLSDCDVRTQDCGTVEMVTTNAATTATCKVQFRLGDRTLYTHTTSSRRTSPTTTLCPLPAEVLQLFSGRFDFGAHGGPGYDFNNLPLGSSALTYSLSISNDGLQYSSTQQLRLYDSLCSTCGTDCTQKPNTCVINGYCFSSQDSNPFTSCLVCQPAVSTNRWTYVAGSVVCPATTTTTDSSLPPGYAPDYGRPELIGPVVINRLWLEFYCSVPVISANSSARFEIQFTFDGVVQDDVPVFTVDVENPRATLHEKYLHGKLDSSIGCKVVSYWIETTSQRSRTLSSVNTYLVGIQASSYMFVVREGDTEPVNLALFSTLPITCQSTDSRGQPINCFLSFVIESSEDIAVGQRSNETNSELCSYVLSESDWNEEDSRAYNDVLLDIKAKIDVYVTGVRQNWVRLSLPVLPDKTINGITYRNPWSGYRLKPVVRVDRYDEPASATCRSSGDPHVTTFDGLYYHTFAVGTFVYVRSKSGLPLEVQVRQSPCSPGATVACVCGVALREGDHVLVAYKCKKSQYEQEEAQMRFITFDRQLPENAVITNSGNGYSFMLKMPSGNKVIGQEYSWGMNIEIIMVGKRPTSGLCGSYDNSQSNDMTRSDGSVDPPAYSGFAPDFVDSWRVNTGRTLFDNYLVELPTSTERVTNFCLCSAGVPTCGSNALLDQGILPGEPGAAIRPRIPESVAEDGDDNVDHTYDPTAFNQTVINTAVPQWPTSNGITQAQAEAGCRSRIFNNETISPMCLESLTADYITRVVQKCVDDVQVSGSFAWAADKIPEVQRSCINSVLTRNNSDADTNQTSIRDIVNHDAMSVAETTCEPVDCNGHGTCVNGTCRCAGDYTGTDCAVSASVVPGIVGLLDPADCDVRMRSCASIYLAVANFTTNAMCRIQIAQSSGLTIVPALIQSRTTLVCPLPTDPLSLFSSRANFTTLHGPGFDFNKLPQGNGGLLTYSVSVSNDGLSYSVERTITVFDSVCFNCVSNGCTRTPNTCVIRGYCFASGAANPYNTCYSCSPRQKQNLWKLTGKKKKCCKKHKKCRRFV